MEEEEKQRLIKEALDSGRFTKCPDASAPGASDLETWAFRRAKGQSGVTEKKPRKQQKRKPKRRQAKRGGGKAARVRRWKARQAKLTVTPAKQYNG